MDPRPDGSRTVIRFLQREDAGIEELGGKLVVYMVATLSSWTLDKNDVYKNAVLCVSYVWQLTELGKALVSRGLNTKSGQLVRNSLVSNCSQHAARREVCLGNLTVIWLCLLDRASS